MAVTYRRGDRGSRGRRRPATSAAPGPGGRDVTRDEALRRIAAAVSGRTDLAALFDDVIDFTASLFSVERAALWLIDDSAAHPFQLAAHRGLSPAIRQAVSGLTMASRATGVQVVRDRKLRVLQDAATSATAAEMRRAYAADGIETVCFVPVVFRDRMLGLLVLYHEKRREWPAEELELAAAFADQMASAIENARLYRRRSIWPPGSGRSRTSAPGSTGSRTCRASPRRSSPRRGASSTTTTSASTGSITPRRRASRSRSRACSWASRACPGTSSAAGSARD